ncbi:MAG TPA: FliM/FliN family flagellar motor switch protein [Terriglobales bacterium]|nr:FliM/FliN family flagellar motor switch protein [Terriglobales bacterium]
MEKVLNQEEIDAMVRAARGGAPVEGQMPAPMQVELWDIRRAGQIGREQLQAITQLHEGFARNLTHALGAYLRVVFAAALVSAEHLSFREFLQRIPETTYLASCRLDPMGVNAALQLDLKVAFPIIDLLLGGAGKAMADTREITEIEEQILDSIARIICRELGAAWQALALEVGFEERLEPGVAQRLMAPEEKILSLSFEVTMPDVRGGLNLAVPVVVSNALLRKISADWSHRPSRGSGDSRRRLMQRLMDCSFQVELGAKDVRIPLQELVSMAPGTLLPFGRSASQPASLLIAGVEMFHATPARCAEVRAARVLDRITEAPDPQDVKEESR